MVPILRASFNKLHPQIDSSCLEFEVVTPVVMKSSVFWDITPCSVALLATCFQASFLLDLFFDSEIGGDTFLRNVGRFSKDFMALYPIRLVSF
jgi:hypothetical protein